MSKQKLIKLNFYTKFSFGTFFIYKKKSRCMQAVVMFVKLIYVISVTGLMFINDRPCVSVSLIDAGMINLNITIIQPTIRSCSLLKQGNCQSHMSNVCGVCCYWAWIWQAWCSSSTWLIRVGWQDNRRHRRNMTIVLNHRPSICIW